MDFPEPPERLPEEFVPDGYEADPLPDDVHEFVDRQAMALAESYHFDHRVEEEDVDYEREVEQFLSQKPWKWHGRGSERKLACLGRSRGGDPFYRDLRGVVVKLNPWIRTVDENNPWMVSGLQESGNLHELAVWKYVVDHRDTELFADILDYSEQGDWLAQELVIPVYRTGSPYHVNIEMDYISERRSALDTIDPFVDELEARGYDPHVKDGNVGMTFPGMKMVMVDFGAHFGTGSPDLTLYALNE